ncbi:MAG: Gfo/Idh/MocA family oxidoreductase [Undibacterium sp.]|nr:Gfo/Idh/MocA family oxidoreductase [Opitutaceae bacterium]
MKSWTRKDFLKASLVGSGAAFIAGQTRLFGQVAPAAGSANGDIRIAVVGINSQGNNHLRDYATNKLKGARVVAICDVDSVLLAKRAQECKEAGAEVETFGDYRKLLESKNIDAIVLGTPNHQHSLQSIWGLQAGKDVYCEKPLSHNVWEGRQAVAASQKYTKNLLVVGTQNRSSLDIPEAIAYINSGKLGKILFARGLCYKERASIGKTEGPQAVPDTVNYDLWSGPAPLVPSRRNSKARGPVHYDWHWFWNYGGGDIANQGIHQMDIARWMLGEQGLPPSVMSIGGRFGYVDDAETPNSQIAVFNYAKAPLIFEVRGLPMKTGMKAMDAYRGSRVGVVVQCEGGYATVSESGTANIFDNDNKKLEGFTNGGNGAHRANFVKALQDRKVIKGLVTEAHTSSSLCHLANISYLVGEEKSNSAIREAVYSSLVTSESYSRMLEHLRANDVDVLAGKSVKGALLKIDAKTEMFTGGEQVLVDAANNSPLRKRTGRGEFTIPQLA